MREGLPRRALPGRPTRRPYQHRQQRRGVPSMPATSPQRNHRRSTATSSPGGSSAATGETSAVSDTARQFRARRRGSMPAKGGAEWKGDVPTGTGTFTAGDTIGGGYTYKPRFEDGAGSNPEQLIGAAHAACFSMALASLLAGAGSPPASIHTEASVTLRPVDE